MRERAPLDIKKLRHLQTTDTGMFQGALYCHAEELLRAAERIEAMQQTIITTRKYNALMTIAKVAYRIDRRDWSTQIEQVMVERELHHALAELEECR